MTCKFILWYTAYRWLSGYEEKSGGSRSFVFISRGDDMKNSEKVGNISEIVKKISQPIANDLGFEIWDVKFLKEGPNYILRVFIDKEEGIVV